MVIESFPIRIFTARTSSALENRLARRSSRDCPASGGSADLAGERRKMFAVHDPEPSPREVRAMFIEKLEAAAELIDSAICSPESVDQEQVAGILAVRREIELAIALARKTWILD
jgi:hypothetical protein